MSAHTSQVLIATRYTLAGGVVLVIAALVIRFIDALNRKDKTPTIGAGATVDADD